MFNAPLFVYFIIIYSGVFILSLVATIHIKGYKPWLVLMDAFESCRTWVSSDGITGGKAVDLKSSDDKFKQTTIIQTSSNADHVAVSIQPERGREDQHPLTPNHPLVPSVPDPSDLEAHRRTPFHPLSVLSDQDKEIKVGSEVAAIPAHSTTIPVNASAVNTHVIRKEDTPEKQDLIYPAEQIATQPSPTDKPPLPHQATGTASLTCSSLSIVTSTRHSEKPGYTNPAALDDMTIPDRTPCAASKLNPEDECDKHDSKLNHAIDPTFIRSASPVSSSNEGQIQVPDPVGLGKPLPTESISGSDSGNASVATITGTIVPTSSNPAHLALPPRVPQRSDTHLGRTQRDGPGFSSRVVFHIDTQPHRSNTTGTVEDREDVMSITRTRSQSTASSRPGVVPAEGFVEQLARYVAGYDSLGALELSQSRTRRRQASIDSDADGQRSRGSRRSQYLTSCYGEGEGDYEIRRRSQRSRSRTPVSMMRSVDEGRRGRTERSPTDIVDDATDRRGKPTGGSVTSHTSLGDDNSSVCSNGAAESEDLASDMDKKSEFDIDSEVRRVVLGRDIPSYGYARQIASRVPRSTSPSLRIDDKLHQQGNTVHDPPNNVVHDAGQVLEDCTQPIRTVTFEDDSSMHNKYLLNADKYDEQELVRPKVDHVPTETIKAERLPSSAELAPLDEEVDGQGEGGEEDTVSLDEAIIEDIEEETKVTGHQIENENMKLSIGKQRLLALSVSYMASYTAAWMNLCGKAAMAMLKQTIQGDNQFARWESYLILIGLVVAVVLSLKLMSYQMKQFPAVVIVPIYQCMFIIGLIFVGAFYYRELSAMADDDMVIFLVSIFICILGIYLITLSTASVKVTQSISNISRQKPLNSRTGSQFPSNGDNDDHDNGDHDKDDLNNNSDNHRSHRYNEDTNYAANRMQVPAIDRPQVSARG